MGEEPKFESLDDSFKEAESNWIERIKKSRWGYWKYNPNNLTLEIAKKGAYPKSNPYYVDLEQCNTSAQVLDWIFQLKNKTWCSDKDIANLLRAFDDLMNIVQGKVCSGGINRRFNFKTHLLKNINPILKK